MKSKICQSFFRYGLPILLWSWAALCPFTVEAAQKMEKVSIAYSSLSGNMAPLWAAYEGGFFRKYGLDVQMVFISSGSRVVQAMMSGDVPIAQVAGASVLQSNLQGGDAVMIAGVVNTLIFQLYVDKKITQPEQLKGKVVAVSRFGSSTDFAMRYALDKYGLAPEKDVTILQLETQPAMLTALQAGKIQGAMLSSPTNLRAKKLGLRMLADLQMLGLEYQHTGLATTRSLIKSRPELVRNIMMAYVEGIHYYKTHRKEALAILGKYLKTEDAEILTDTYESIGLTLIPEKPYPTLRGIQIMLRELTAKEPKAQSAKPEQFVDLTFVKELDASGFIDKLYQQAPVVAKRAEPQPAPAAVKEKGKAEPAKLTAKKAAPAAAQPKAREHTVQSGDTLSRLATRFYGAPEKWQKIYEANRGKLKNPNSLYVGQKITIPPAD